MTVGTDVEDQVHRTRQHLFGAYRQERNKLAAQMNASVTEVVLTYPAPGLAQGSHLTIDMDRMHVWSYDPQTLTATVERGIDGSTAHGHIVGDFVEVNPRFDTFAIVTAIKNEIQSWDESLFRVVADEITFAQGNGWADLPSTLAEAYFVIEARLRSTPVSFDEPITTWDRFPLVPRTRIMRSAHTDWFASGEGVQLGILPAVSSQVQLIVAAPFDVVSDWALDTDMISNVGLQRSMLDLAPMGAAIRLLADQEANRSDMGAQGQPRIAEESPPMYMTQTVQGMYQRYVRRMKQEASKLSSRYPVRT
jgi:hypothetical protein